MAARALVFLASLGLVTVHLTSRALEAERGPHESFERIVGRAVMYADGLPEAPVSPEAWEAAGEAASVLRYYTEEAIASSTPLVPGVGRLVAIEDAAVRMGEAAPLGPDRLSIHGRSADEARFEPTVARDGRVLIVSGPYGDWYQNYTLELLLEPSGAGLELTAVSCYMASDVGNAWLKPSRVQALVDGTDDGCAVYFWIEVDQIPVPFRGQVTLGSLAPKPGGELRRLRALERAQLIGPGVDAPLRAVDGEG